ncbi:hypothetical protein ABZ413_33515 [Nocardia rhamnosiphila]|uniref:hypothetical protein n=1 Tax=Nocardia rhamnosiphila TaxID=426716 RepID=UPI00340B7856
MRFSGEIADITALLDTLAAAGVELTGTSRPYANQRGTGVRVYTPSPRRNTPGPDRSGTHSAAHRSGRRAGPRGRRVNVAAGRSDSSSHPIRYRQKEMSQ